MSEVKRYTLNRDFTIECEMGDKMSVRVIMISLPFEPVIEEIKDIKDKNVANQKFKELAQKYKTGVSFAKSTY